MAKGFVQLLEIDARMVGSERSIDETEFLFNFN